MSNSKPILLTIDLSSGNVKPVELGQTVWQRWLGGRALNVAVLARILPDPVSPLGPENPLILSCGLLTGTRAPSASRLHINAVSPLTGFLGSSNVGGDFGAGLRSCGFMGLVITGRSTRPVYLEISTDGGHIHPAEKLWTLDTHTSQDRLESRYQSRYPDEKIHSLIIGPAGENLNRFACIVTDKDHVAGRTGMGAVMGSKLLKAVVVRKPTSRMRPTSSETARVAVREYIRKIRAAPAFRIFSKSGGAGYVKWAHDKGFMGAKNYRETGFEPAARIDEYTFQEYTVKTRGCRGCPVRCKAVLEFHQKRFNNRPVYRSEFEPMINLGAKCGLTDPEAVVYLDNLCTRLGVDSTSAATAVSFAMDLRERGLLKPSIIRDMDDLSWGNEKAMESLIRQMAAMEGFGRILGMGTREAANLLGVDAEPSVSHVKGLELTAYHPASLLGTALGYAVSSRGGDYNNVYASLEHRWSPEAAKAAFGTARAVDPASHEGKGKLVQRAVCVNIVVDSLGICKVPALSMVGTFDLVPESTLTAGVTGENLSSDDLLEIGLQTAALERLINFHLGLEMEDDTLPERFFGVGGINRKQFVQMRRDFYLAMGWNEDGTLPKLLLDKINDNSINFK